MRRPLLLFILVNAAVLLFLTHSVWTLITLLFADGAEDILTRAELSGPGSSQIDERPQSIPKIIHQTYKNESIPEIWQEAQASCLDLHPEPEWEYRMWTDEMAEDFIAAEYGWFLETFQNYPHNIQRADAIRYFVLAHYGGIYIDLDDGCNRPLAPLLSYPAFVRRTIPTGISNDVMGAAPKHPFFLRVIDSLMDYDRNWLLPYITVMASTGPLFLSLMWRHWSADGLNFGDGRDGGRIRILFPNEYNGHSWSFFTHHTGNSWHGSDVHVIFWMARHWVFLTVAGFIVGFSALYCGWELYRRFVLGTQDAHGPRWRAAARRSGMALWRRVSPHRKDYELVDQHVV